MFQKIEKFILVLLLLFFPIVFWPSATNTFETPKMVFAAGLIFLILLFCAIRLIFSQTINLKSTAFDLPVILFALAYLFLGIFRSSSIIDAFFMPGSASVILILTFIYFLVASNFAKERKTLFSVILLSGVLASTISLLAISGALVKIPFIPQYLKNPIFSTLGGLLPQAIFLTSLIPLGIGVLIEEKELAKKIFWGTSVAIIILTASLNIYKIFAKNSNVTLPPFDTSWAVATDSIKESPFWGIGPGGYSTAFSRFKPVSFNTTKIWSLNFATSSNFLLTVITETGLIGFGILILLIIKIYRVFAKKIKVGLFSLPLESGVFVSLLVSFLALLIFPSYLTSVFLFFVLLSLVSDKNDLVINLKLASTSKTVSRIPAMVVSLITVLVISFISLYAFKYIKAEYYYASALKAISLNDAKSGYEKISKAISINPKFDKYQISLSQVDIALASAIAQKKNLTDTDKTTITQLIQQAIQTAKNAVSLNPKKSSNWRNLAVTYQSIMPFAQGADNFAIQSYTQAISLEPTDPNLRISLGGVYFALGRYDEAINSFKLAVLAKSDLANAHYNLSAAYTQKNEIDKAVNEMTLVLGLVNKDSEDYKLAQSQLEALKKRLPVKTETKTSELTQPTAPQKQVIQPPIKLPEEANPPTTTQ